MKHLTELCEAAKQSQTMILATTANDSVTMRTVSPVLYQEKILIFTSPKSRKYQQLQANPHCAFMINDIFVEATTQFLGATLAKENQAYQKAYLQKFNDAFDEKAAFNGCQAEFVLFTPQKITSWSFNDS